MTDLPTIDLNFVGWLKLTVPGSDRSISIPPTPEGLDYLIRILKQSKEHRSKENQRKGYLRNFPTQAVVDSWIAGDRAAKQQAKLEAQAAELGVDINSLEIEL